MCVCVYIYICICIFVVSVCITITNRVMRHLTAAGVCGWNIYAIVFSITLRHICNTTYLPRRKLIIHYQRFATNNYSP